MEQWLSGIALVEFQESRVLITDVIKGLGEQKIPKRTTAFSSLGIPDILYIKYTGLVKAITIIQVISGRAETNN